MTEIFTATTRSNPTASLRRKPPRRVPPYRSIHTLQMSHAEVLRLVDHGSVERRVAVARNVLREACKDRGEACPAAFQHFQPYLREHRPDGLSLGRRQLGAPTQPANREVLLKRTDLPGIDHERPLVAKEGGTKSVTGVSTLRSSVSCVRIAICGCRRYFLRSLSYFNAVPLDKLIG